MRLKINKACDLSSISVLPPPSRPTGLGLGSDPSGLGKSQASQLRSQSQQSFSQGMSLSQLSQNSLEENPASDQRFGSQERDNSSKKSLVPIASMREEHQIQLSRTSTNALRRWSSASIPDNRSLVNEELEHRFQIIEGSLNRLGMIIDSVQSDVMQANRAMKEVSLETEVIRQKISLVENSMQKMLRAEEDIKDFLEGRLKAVPVQMDKESDPSKLNEILSSLSALPRQIQVNLFKLQHEICNVFSKETEVIVRNMKSLNNNHLGAVQLIENQGFLATKQSQRCRIQTNGTPTIPPKNQRGTSGQVGCVKTMKAKLTNSKHNGPLKQEEIPSRPQVFRINIESDDECDRGASCLLLKKETGRESYLIDEAREETMRILRRARKRRRRQNNTVIIV
ncbi:putative protein PAIR1 [Dioscorea sansibarensis]